jgi:Arc/MetJ family transcription regulator
MMKEQMKMRTTINVSDQVLKETEELYNTTNRSKAVENALKDAVRFKKLQMLIDLKGKLSFDVKSIASIRRSEIDETDNG